MTNIKLSKRLSLIASMVDKGSITADIGCDHALLDIYLIQNKIVKKSIACDITEGALNQAKKNILINNINKIETRLGNGLDPITKKDDVNTIIMSGLGNIKIKEILYNNTKKLKNINTIIIQSNTGNESIREDIVKLGFYIKDEVMIKENNIIYLVIKFCKGIKKYSKKELFYGPILLKNKGDLFCEYFKLQIDKNKKVIKALPFNKIHKKFKFLLLNLFMYKNINK